MINEQLDFAFLADPTDPERNTQTRKRASPSKARGAKLNPRSATSALVTAALSQPAPDLESMARSLEAHPDYRVIRRLRPRLEWPDAPDRRKCTVLVLDTETTGLDASKEKIIELALLRVQVDLDSGEPLGSVSVYGGFEDPGKPVPKEIEKITGITTAMVKGQSLDATQVSEMLRGVDLVIAHNAGFDRPFVESRFPEFGAVDWACSFAGIDWKEQGRASAKLENLVQSLGYFYDAHRAEMDCHALLAVLAAPLAKVVATQSERKSGVNLCRNGLSLLIGSTQTPAYLVEASNAPFDVKDLLKARGYRWNADKKLWFTRLSGTSDLQSECAWLKEFAYGNRAAMIQVEKLDARVRYSSRQGEAFFHPL